MGTVHRLDADALEAACRANIHPLSDPSDTERRYMAKAITAYFDALEAKRNPPVAPVPEPALDPFPAADGWVRWTGGECPVAPDARVQFRLPVELEDANPSISEDADGRRADSLRWTWIDGAYDNIALYRVMP